MSRTSEPELEPDPDGGRPRQVRLRLDVAYDGSGFHGFAENTDVATVGGTLRAALERVARVPAELTCAGRTDAGVHARGQVVTVDVPASALDDLARRDRRGRDGAERLRDGVNGLIGPSIVVTAARVVPADFDARFSATSRTYRYTVLNRDVADPFLADRAWWVDEPLDVDAMRAGCPALLGDHDFTSFCRRPKSAPAGSVSLVRRVLAAGWSSSVGEPDVLTFTITATAFCHQMVRAVTGLLVDVGRGRRPPADVATVIEARDRSAAGQLAPPHGLVLWEVGY